MITYIEKTITGTITHGTTSITFTDDFITNESIIDVYFQDDDIVPTEQTQSGNTLTISIESQSNDVDVAVHITNADTIDYDDVIESHTNALTLLDAKVDGLNASNINYDEHSTLYSAMGDIDELETITKNLVGAVNECFQSVSSGKSLIASAITDKGVPTLANDTFETMANNISQISSGGGGGNANRWIGNYINNKYINENNGQEQGYSGWRCTDYIDVSNYNRVLAYENVGSSQPIYNGWYDANKNYIGRLTLPTRNAYSNVTVPSGAKYFRLSGLNSSDLIAFGYTV